MGILFKKKIIITAIIINIIVSSTLVPGPWLLAPIARILVYWSLVLGPRSSAPLVPGPWAAPGSQPLAPRSSGYCSLVLGSWLLALVAGRQDIGPWPLVPGLRPPWSPVLGQPLVLSPWPPDRQVIVPWSVVINYTGSSHWFHRKRT